MRAGVGRLFTKASRGRSCAARARGGWSTDDNQTMKAGTCGPCARGLVAEPANSTPGVGVRPVRAGVGPPLAKNPTCHALWV